MPFMSHLNTALIIVVLIIYGKAFIAVFFLRETKHERDLRNTFQDIYPEEEYTVYGKVGQ